MFEGRHRRSIDDKKRVAIPADFKEELGKEFVVRKNLFHKNIVIYSLDLFQQDMKRSENLPDEDKMKKKLRRVLLGTATQVSCDKQGRIQIPEQLLKRVNIADECVIVGMDDHLEMISIEQYEEETKRSK